MNGVDELREGIHTGDWRKWPVSRLDVGVMMLRSGRKERGHRRLLP